jgi:DNA-binding MarR family transcriptional regulator
VVRYQLKQTSGLTSHHQGCYNYIVLRYNKKGGKMNVHHEITLSEYQVLAEFRYHLRRFLHFSEQAARSVGLERRQHQLLLALKGLPERKVATVSEVAERLQIQHHSTVELIDRMGERNLLERSRDESDQRKVIIHLTSYEGEALRQLSSLHRTELLSSGPELVRALHEVMHNTHHNHARSK